MYPQGVCRIRKPAYAGNGCAIFPAFDIAQLGKKVHCSAAGDLFRGSLFLPLPPKEAGAAGGFFVHSGEKRTRIDKKLHF